MIFLALLLGALFVSALVAGRAVVGLVSCRRDEQPIRFWLAAGWLSAGFGLFVYGAITG